MTGLARRRSHMALSWASAEARSEAASSTSITLLRRTSRTPSKPMPPSARQIAWASGSKTPGRKETSTLAFTRATLRAPLAEGNMAQPAAPCLLHHLRTLEIAGAGLGQDAQPPRDLGVGFLDVAEVTAEAVFVELLVGAG